LLRRGRLEGDPGRGTQGVVASGGRRDRPGRRFAHRLSRRWRLDRVGRGPDERAGRRARRTLLEDVVEPVVFAGPTGRGPGADPTSIVDHTPLRTGRTRARTGRTGAEVVCPGRRFAPGAGRQRQAVG